MIEAGGRAPHLVGQSGGLSQTDAEGMLVE